MRTRAMAMSEVLMATRARRAMESRLLKERSYRKSSLGGMHKWAVCGLPVSLGGFIYSYSVCTTLAKWSVRAAQYGPCAGIV